MEGDPGKKLLPDDIPYDGIYRAIRGIYARSEVKEQLPLRWDRGGLVRFFKRIGTVPPGHSRRRAALRVALASEQMARSGGVPVIEVYRHLCAFTSADSRGLCLERPECPRCPAAPLCRHANRKITIKDLPPEQRPRERLLSQGADKLSDCELLAILIGSGSSGENVMDLAGRLMADFGSLGGIHEAGNNQIARLKGLGRARVARLKAALEAGARSQAQRIRSGVPVQGSKDVYQHFRQELSGKKREVFLCVLLDTRHCIIRSEEISVGSLNESIVHPREAFKRAVRESAHAVIFVHNHPSGNPEPSPQDRNLTRRLVQAGQVMGIIVLDHLIVCKEQYYSFAEHGEIE